METYQPELWHDLYVMLGTSSAALVGLIFVAASLHLQDIVGNDVLFTRTRNITLHLIITLMQAAAILTPQPTTALGIELLLINLCGLWPPVIFTYRVYLRDKRKGARGGFSIYRAMNYVGGYLIGVAGGALFIWHPNLGMYLVTLAYVNFLVGAIWNNWKIMFDVGQIDRRKERTR